MTIPSSPAIFSTHLFRIKSQKKKKNASKWKGGSSYFNGYNFITQTIEHQNSNDRNSYSHCATNAIGQFILFIPVPHFTSPCNVIPTKQADKTSLSIQETKTNGNGKRTERKKRKQGKRGAYLEQSTEGLIL